MSTTISDKTWQRLTRKTTFKMRSSNYKQKPWCRGQRDENTANVSRLGASLTSTWSCLSLWSQGHIMKMVYGYLRQDIFTMYLYILRYATGNSPLYFPVITCAQQFTGVYLRTSQKPAPKLFNSCEPLQTFAITSRSFPKISEHFRRFP